MLQTPWTPSLRRGRQSVSGGGMPDEAQRWFDRAREIDPEHPMSKAAPLFMYYHTRENPEEKRRLARSCWKKELRTGVAPGSSHCRLSMLIRLRLTSSIAFSRYWITCTRTFSTSHRIVSIDRGWACITLVWRY